MAGRTTPTRRQASKGQGAYTLHTYTPEQNAWLAAQHGKNRTTSAIRAEFNRLFQAALSTTRIRQKLRRMGVAFQSQSNSPDGITGFMSSHYKDTGRSHPREKPLGSIRQARDGLEIKVADTPNAGRKNWLPLAKHIYQSAHRVTVQPDEIVFHIDGNPDNNDLDNLILLKRRDIGFVNMLLSQPENRNATPEIRLSLILMARITQTRQAKTGEETPGMRYSRKKRKKTHVHPG